MTPSEQQVLWGLAIVICLIALAFFVKESHTSSAIALFIVRVALFILRDLEKRVLA
jgi:hypothetical protein